MAELRVDARAQKARDHKRDDHIGSNPIAPTKSGKLIMELFYKILSVCVVILISAVLAFLMIAYKDFLFVCILFIIFAGASNIIFKIT